MFLHKDNIKFYNLLEIINKVKIINLIQNIEFTDQMQI